jgi:hypothetical protein
MANPANNGTFVAGFAIRQSIAKVHLFDESAISLAKRKVLNSK